MIESSIQLGEPVEHRGIVIAPLFPRRTPDAAYVTLEQALPLGSCVEEGRWRRRSVRFDSAPHASHPELRRRKVEQLAATPLARGAAQGVVWDAVREKAARLEAHSPTGAQADVFSSRRKELRSLEQAFAAAPGQCGAVFALGDSICLDYVSRPDAFVSLYPKLRAGYLLDAVERLDGKPATKVAIERFLDTITAGATMRQPSAARGEDVRLRGTGVVGSGLALDDELIQLSAFTTDDGGQLHVAQPSRRR